jgi:hypothetical protein
MDSLVKAALDKVNEAVSNIPEITTSTGPDKISLASDCARQINTAIHTVDALKSALKALSGTQRRSAKEIFKGY